MHFDSYKKVLFSDTLLPDIFISDYLPSLDPAHVKIYIYCTFLSKYNIKATVEDISKKLMLTEDTVKQAFVVLETQGLIQQADKGVHLLDIKEKEITRLYREKTTSTPEEAVEKNDFNQRRKYTIQSINNMFFQGVMPPSWYTDIDSWFDKYKFDEDVMVTLFQHCYDQNIMQRKYLAKVASDWHKRKIHTHLDVENYLESFQLFKSVRGQIIKKLGLKRLLTEYEHKYVLAWVLDFGYGLDIIDLALQTTTSRINISFDLLNKIITDWHKKGLKTPDDIKAYIAQRRTTTKSTKSKPTTAPQKNNFEQRNYDDEFFNKLDNKM